jgi:FkbM family methyltransferase
VNRFSQDSNTFINQLAVSNTSGTSTLFTNEYGSGLTSLVKRRLDHFNIGFEKTESVKLIRLEEYWVNVLKKRPIDIMKIDIEGHEFAALLGAGSAIKKIKIIQFEFGGCNIDSKTFFQDFWYFFQQNNFTIFRISPIGLIKIDKYSELDEVFLTTNYLALNNSY